MPDDPLDAYLDPVPRARRGNYNELIQKHAQRTGLDPELVKAVVHQESGGNPRSVSPKGAQGIGQLMPATAKRFGVTDPFDPEQNIRGATDYLKFLNDKFKGNRDLVLAGYNAGEGAVDKYKGIPPYKETRNYVRSINARLGQRQQKPSGDLDSYLDPVSTEQPLPSTTSRERVNRPTASATPPARGQNTAPSIEQALDALTANTNRATQRLQRQAAPQPEQPTARSNLFRQLGQQRTIDETQRQREEQARREAKEELASRRLTPMPTGPFGVRIPSLRGLLAGVSSPVSTVMGIFDSDEEKINQMAQEKLRAQQVAAEPEVTEIRKEYGRMPAAVRSVVAPVVGRGGGGLLKVAGGIASAFGIAPNRLSDWANKRGEIIETGSSLAPLQEKQSLSSLVTGDKELEEIQRGIPEKVLTGVADLGVGLGQIVLLKKATGLPFNQLLALEAAAKSSDKSAKEQLAHAGEAYALGTVLDQHLSRPVSAALFGVPTAAQTSYEVSQGRMSPLDAAIQTGIQAGAGAVLGGGRRTVETEAKSPAKIAPEIPKEVETAAERHKELYNQIFKIGLRLQDIPPPTEVERKTLMDEHHRLLGEILPVERIIREQGYKINPIGEVAKQEEPFPSTLRDRPDLAGKPPRSEGGYVDLNAIRGRAQEEGGADPRLQGTRVTDESGQPLLVHHGTDANFQRFELGPDGAIYFSPDPEIAKTFAENTGNSRSKNPSPRTVSAHLSIKNPKVITNEQIKEFVRQGLTLEDVVRQAKAEGYDGIHFSKVVDFAGRNNLAEQDQWAVFDPSQIVPQERTAAERPISVAPVQPETPQRFYHRDYGEVTESPNQKRVGKGRVRVTAEDGSEHVIKRSSMTGAGNQRAVPIREPEAVKPHAPTDLESYLEPKTTVGAKSINEPQLSDRPDGGFRVKSEEGSLIVRPIVDQDGKPTGDFETFDVFVEPEFRRRGVATKLYAEAQKEATKRGGKLLSSTEQTDAGQALNAGLRRAKEVPRQEMPDLSSEPPASKTSARKEMMRGDRAELDLPELPAPERKSWRSSLDNAKPEDANRLADEVLNKPRALNDEETASLVVRAQQIKNRHAEVMKEIGAESDPDVIARKRTEFESLEKEFDKLTEATKKSGTEKGRTLAAQKLTINQDLDLVSMKNRLKAAKGENLTPQENAKIEELHARLTKAESDLAEANEKLAQKDLQRQIDRASRQRKRTETKKSLDDEFAALQAQFAQARAEARNVQASGLAGLDPEGKLTKIILKMAHNRAKAGTVEAKALVSEIYNAIKEHAEDLTERDIRDAISGYSIAPKTTRSELQKRLDEVRAELHAMSKAEDIAAGVRSPHQEGPRQSEARRLPMEGPRKSEERSSGIPRQGPKLSEVNKLKPEGPRLAEGTGRKQGPRIAEAPKQGPKLGDIRRVPEQGPKMVAHGPETRLFTRDATRRAALEKEEQEILRKMAAGDFEKPEKRKIEYTRETYEKEKRVRELKAEFEKMRYRATRSLGGKVADTAVSVGNLPKTLLSMADVSALLRQGGVGYMQHPVLSTRAARDMLRSFTEHGFANVENAIKASPEFENAKRSGVEFTGIDRDDPRLSHREEGYLGSSAIDTLAKGRFNPVRGVKAVKDFSERTFVSFLDSQRMRIFEQQAQSLRDMGLTGKDLDAAMKSQAKYINIITGRGSLGAQGNKVAPALNLAMFSPRLVASRFQLLNKMFNPGAWASMPKGARKLQMIDNAKFLVGTAAVLGLAKAAGASVNLDKDDADFLKIKVGSTRYDTLAGLQQPMRFMLRMAQAIKGGETYSGDPKGDIFADFMRSKASPEIGLTWDYLEGKNRLSGKGFEGKDVARTLIPLPAQDFYEAIKEDGKLRGTVETLPALLGVGVQTYKGSAEKPITPAEKLARRFTTNKMPDEARDQQEIDVDQKKSELRARARKGEDVMAEVKALGSKITERQARGILSAKNKTRLQEDLNRLGIKDALLVYSVASPAERSQIVDILARKQRLIEMLPDSDREVVRKRWNDLGLGASNTRFGRPDRPSRPMRATRQ